MSIYRYIHLKDLQKYYNVSKNTASVRFTELKKACGKNNPSINDLARYEGEDAYNVCSFLDM